MRNLLLLVLVGCAGGRAPEKVAPKPVASVPVAVVSAPSVVASASVDPEVVVPPKPKPPSISATEAEAVLYLGKTPTTVAAACASAADDDARIRCLISHRYDQDSAAEKLALDLFASSGDVVGVEPKQTFDGGYRGMIELVPELPIGKHRKHLAWVKEGADDFDATYTALSAVAAAGQKTVGYRWRALTLRFFRSVDRTTPNGFASKWGYSYNVSGSLLHSAVAVRELMVHEIFHLNDSAHGEWSSSKFGTFQADIIAKCGTKIACLTPYAPHDTIVKNGTYYAFQPGNGPWEYAAELAVRHYREHRAILKKEPAIKPFKCGPAPNGKAWQLFVDEFWAGVDLVPPCP